MLHTKNIFVFINSVLWEIELNFIPRCKMYINVIRSQVSSRLVFVYNPVSDKEWVGTTLSGTSKKDDINQRHKTVYCFHILVCTI